MINANELRIGNWVLDDLIPCKVIELLEKHINHSNAYHAPYEEIKPIPLTHYILLKCGFREIGNTRDFYNDDLNIGISNHNGEKSLYNNDDLDTPPIPLESLHQLQNIIFCLTGEELEIKF